MRVRVCQRYKFYFVVFKFWFNTLGSVSSRGKFDDYVEHIHIKRVFL